jgi:signal transduction histidine kinase
VKIWRPDGTVIYANMAKDIIGQHFVSTDVAKAASGKIVAEFKDMVSAESAYEQSLGKALIEIYSPLYKDNSNTVVAVGEVYEDASDLDAQLRASRRETWIVVCLTTLLMLAFLYIIVRRGSSTIALQRTELKERIADAQHMASQNERLRLEANEANEDLLGRIGADIHDGPIQALTLTRLRIDEIAEIWSDRRQSKSSTSQYLDEARSALGDSIDELRHLSTGLVLPELDALSPRELIELARDRHEGATATQVELDLGELPQALPSAMKICVYRIIQESLTNAFRHAGGVGQQVAAAVRGNFLELRISDQGAQAATPAEEQASHTKLGHRGIRNRVQAFGGRLSIERTEKGTDVRVSLPLDRDGA